MLQGKGLVKWDKQSDLLDALDGGNTGDVEDACVLGGVFRQNFDGGGTHVDGAACHGGADGGVGVLSFSRTELKLNILCLRENRILCRSIVD